MRNLTAMLDACEASLERLASRLDARERKVPSVLYHVTPGQNAASVRKSGLKASPDEILYPDKRAGVNFVSDPDELPYFAPRNAAWFKVSTAGLDKDKFHHFGEGWWRYHGSVPASKVKKTRVEED